MKRKQAIKNILFLLLTPLLSAEDTLSLKKQTLLDVNNTDRDKSFTFNDKQRKVLRQMAETIIPTNESYKGLQGMDIIPKIEEILQEYAPKPALFIIKQILNLIDVRSFMLTGTAFTKASKEKKAEILQVLLDKNTLQVRALYLLITFVYVTSEQGVRETFNFLPVPGRYQADLTYNENEKIDVGLGRMSLLG